MMKLDRSLEGIVQLIVGTILFMHSIITDKLHFTRWPLLVIFFSNHL